ncbi:DNA-3-methyladenine glycosylase [Okibacterium endophyticum]
MNREFFLRSAVEVAPQLLGAVLSHTTDDGTVSVRLTEVEAYVGQGVDPGSHAFRGQTKRNATMFGEPGHLYTYFTYGMHVCGNIVCSPPGEASGVLLRAGEIVHGIDLARARRTTSKRDSDLAQGPGRLAVALGLTLNDDGSDVFAHPFALEISTPEPVVAESPRTGVSGPGGSADYPWRFFVPGEPTVSPYKKHPTA